MTHDKQDEIKRPITLYVHEVIDEIPDLEHLHTVPTWAMDLELNERDAIKLRDYLSKRIDQHVGGTIRARCKGHLVI